MLRGSFCLCWASWPARTEPADCFSALMTVAFCHLSCAILLMFQCEKWHDSEPVSLQWSWNIPIRQIAHGHGDNRPPVLPLQESTAHATVHRMADAGRRFVCSLHTTCSECTAKALTPMWLQGSPSQGTPEAGRLWGLTFLCILLPSEDHSRTDTGGRQWWRWQS